MNVEGMPVLIIANVDHNSRRMPESHEVCISQTFGVKESGLCLTGVADRL